MNTLRRTAGVRVVLLVALSACSNGETDDPFGAGGGSGGGAGDIPVQDLQPPSVLISVPSAFSTVPPGQLTVTGIASDAIGVARVEVQINDTPAVLATGLESWTYVSPPLTTGNYAIRATAFDDAGNSATDAIAITVGQPVDNSNNNASGDMTPPTVAITSPVDAVAIGLGPLSVTGTASDDVEVARVVANIDLGTSVEATGTTDWAVTLDASGLSTGVHVIFVNAFDTAGNASTVATRTFTVDPTQPVAALIGAPPSPSVLNVATIRVSGSNVTTYEFQLDDGGYGAPQDVSFPILVVGLSDGVHRLDVIGISP
ncbi:MAG: Ig-like domain-containing protein, partial [Myxococcota bacterium]